MVVLTVSMASFLFLFLPLTLLAFRVLHRRNKRTTKKKHIVSDSWCNVTIFPQRNRLVNRNTTTMKNAIFLWRFYNLVSVDVLRKKLFRIPLICNVNESQIKGEKYELKFKLIRYSLVACHGCPKENFKFQFRIDFKWIANFPYFS